MERGGEVDSETAARAKESGRETMARGWAEAGEAGPTRAAARARGSGERDGPGGKVRLGRLKGFGLNGLRFYSFPILILV